MCELCEMTHVDPVPWKLLEESLARLCNNTRTLERYDGPEEVAKAVTQVMVGKDIEDEHLNVFLCMRLSGLLRHFARYPEDVGKYRRPGDRAGQVPLAILMASAIAHLPVECCRFEKDDLRAIALDIILEDNATLN